MKRRMPVDTKTPCLRAQLLAGSILALLVFSSVFARAAGPHTLAVGEGERWWAGVISQSHLMPLHDRPYAFDSYANTAGNQVQPLLISDQGRYI